MPLITKIEVADGTHSISIPEAGLHILCGCPADSVKHLMKRGLIQNRVEGAVHFETGPNAILLADTLIQHGQFSNLSEFPILQMFYRQGLIIPGHPNNTGLKPVLIGSRRQVEAQMEYVFRGNYGLVSEEEIMDAGVPAGVAKDMMRLKLKFAFGKIRRMEEYLDLLVLESEPKEIRAGVMVRRVRTNVFEISYKGERVQVDLTLSPPHSRQPSYVLGFHQIRRDYFGVLHSGEGDGWDPNRPAMASIILFQGRVYLIDAGPNILYSLNALGISVNEIAGIFHTHAHDDHFCGLADLMRADHRIPYYATPLVRSSVTKKLAALSMMHEDEFGHYFEFNDLVMGQWNDIDTLEVMPVFSPHPVETTVLYFRTLDRSGYRTYAHMADISSLSQLRAMVTDDDEAPGLSQGLYDAVAHSYLQPVDLKKLDIGGGMIHGDAEDFAQDQSGKIVLAHTAQLLTMRQKQIGSGAPFGTVDTLVPAHQDYTRSYAFHLLQSYFPDTPRSRLRVLMNNPIDKFNPESIILKAKQKAKSVYLVLTGQVEMIRSSNRVYSILSAGAMLGETTALTGKALGETYRATNFVQALRIPLDLYLTFVKNCGLYDQMLRLSEVRDYLYSNPLFVDSVSCMRHNAIAAAVVARRYPAGQQVPRTHTPCLSLLVSGKAELVLGEKTVERLKPGDFFCESTVLFEVPCLYRCVLKTESTIYTIPAGVLSDIPIIRWKLLEVYESRLAKAVAKDSEVLTEPWREDYDTGVEELDKEHRALYRQALELYADLLDSTLHEDIQRRMLAFIERIEEHFGHEEQLMCDSEYPGASEHVESHREISLELRRLAEIILTLRSNRRREMGNLFRSQVMTHIFTEDRLLGAHMRACRKDCLDETSL